MINTARMWGASVPLTSKAWTAALEVISAADDLQEFAWSCAVSSGTAWGFGLFNTSTRWIYFDDGTFLLQSGEVLLVARDTEAEVRNLLTGTQTTG